MWYDLSYLSHTSLYISAGNIVLFTDYKLTLKTGVSGVSESTSSAVSTSKFNSCDDVITAASCKTPGTQGTE